MTIYLLLMVYKVSRYQAQMFIRFVTLLAENIDRDV